MSNDSNYLKMIILEAEALEMDMCASANRYVALLKKQKLTLDEAIRSTEVKIKEAEKAQKKLLESEKD